MIAQWFDRKLDQHFAWLTAAVAEVHRQSHAIDSGIGDQLNVFGRPGFFAGVWIILDAIEVHRANHADAIGGFTPKPDFGVEADFGIAGLLEFAAIGIAMNILRQHLRKTDADIPVVHDTDTHVEVGSPNRVRVAFAFIFGIKERQGVNTVVYKQA